jgi:23S rRNA (cytosine1962-C5)-methyltransferase
LELLCPENFKDYDLLDCGNFEKLERFGNVITIRPEPQAVWPAMLKKSDWIKQAHFEFVPRSSSAGDWKKIKASPEQWIINYEFFDKKKIYMRLGLTSFKHVGVFPEQAVNWNFIYSYFRNKTTGPKKFLNLFAYTGGASLAARAAGADVTHVDSIKQVVTWANENMNKSGLDNIRWMVDDALKFVKKEQRRGNFYQGIILDPPSYGHGPSGEKWKLEEQISEMIDSVLAIADQDKHLVILNTYSLGLSALIPENLLKPFAEKTNSVLSIGELYLRSKTEIKLPLGVWGKLVK